MAGHDVGDWGAVLTCAGLVEELETLVPAGRAAAARKADQLHLGIAQPRQGVLELAEFLIRHAGIAVGRGHHRGAGSE